MLSIVTFLEQEGHVRTSTSPSENWRLREEESARRALERGRISQQQWKKHMDKVRDMANKPGGPAKAGTFTYGSHEHADEE